jgi:hypothetical protein
MTTLFWPGTTLEGVGEEMTEKDPGRVYVTVIEPVPVFPTASDAVIVIVFPPDCNGTEAVHDVVPAALPEPPVEVLVQITPVTPTLSEAVPLSVAGELVSVALSAGEMILTTGFVVSGGV